MWQDYGRWKPYVPVAKRRLQAKQEIARLLRKNGKPVAPVEIRSRTIASTFWGKAWCDNLESYRDYDYRLPRGRSYVRNGSVIDLQIGPRQVTAMVSGSSLYQVTVTVGAAAKKQWKALCRDCAGGIESLVELLQGRFSNAVMQRLCRQDGGLLPKPSEISFSCSCPDWAMMCKHVAATLYGVGARLDEKPELLFLLRGVDQRELVADLGAPLSRSAPADGKLLNSDDLSALFGLEMATAETDAAPAEPSSAASRVRTKERGGPSPRKGKAAAFKSKRPPAPPKESPGRRSRKQPVATAKPASRRVRKAD